MQGKFFGHSRELCSKNLTKQSGKSAEKMPVQLIKAESQVIEVKAAHEGCPKRLYDTISAFSNQDSGGIILFGIDETKGYEIVGVYDVQDLQKKVNEQCKQMSPVVRPVFEDLRSEFVVTFFNEDMKKTTLQDTGNENSLLAFCREPRSRKEIAEFVGVSTIYYVTQNYISPLLESGKLKMTIPGHPKSKNQKYYSAL